MGLGKPVAAPTARPRRRWKVGFSSGEWPLAVSPLCNATPEAVNNLDLADST
uniref:Uncharacterized protein n=1 Tax=Mesocestoides corti TaxID=53468 RepID=A0A5K3G255_MESCO